MKFQFQVETVGIDGNVLFTDTVIFRWRAEKRVQNINDGAFASPLRLARIAATGETDVPLPWYGRIA